MKNSHNALAAGAILVSSWGYDQTNIDFYQVVRRTAQTVTVRPLATQRQYGVMQMTSQVVPIPDEFTGDPIRRKVHDDSGYIAINEYAMAHPWGGRVETATHYA